MMKYNSDDRNHRLQPTTSSNKGSSNTGQRRYSYSSMMIIIIAVVVSSALLLLLLLLLGRDNDDPSSSSSVENNHKKVTQQHRNYVKTNNNMNRHLMEQEQDNTAADDASSFSYEGVVDVLHHWTTTTTTSNTPTQSNVLQVVSYREMFLGCYSSSFENALSPMFHTLIIMPQDIIEKLHIQENLILNNNLTASETAGLHIFSTQVGGMGGNHHARKIAEQFITNELEQTRGITNIRYIHSIDCNVHPLPTNHSKYVSLEQITLRMERDFDIAKMTRNVGRNIETNYNVDGYPFDTYRNKCHHSCSAPTPMGKMKILAMNTVFFEDVPIIDDDDEQQQQMGIFHGHDDGHWWRTGGWTNKPRNLTNAALPWIYDKSATFEAHAVMFDLDVLRTVKDEYFAVSKHSFPDENHFIGEFARKKNYTLIRHNDVALHIDFAHFSTYSHYPHDFDLDWYKERNLEELVSHRNPLDQQANWDRVHQYIPEMANTNHGPFTKFLFYHFHKDMWLPSIFDDGKKKPITDPTVLNIIKLLLKYCGYTFKGSTADGMLRFEMEHVYPGSRYVGLEQRNGKNRRFFSYFDPVSNTKTSLFVDTWKTGPPPIVADTNYTLEIPEAATMNRNGFHFSN